MLFVLYANHPQTTAPECIIGSIQSFLGQLGFGPNHHIASAWLFFAACGLGELVLSFLVCTPLEKLSPLSHWPERNSIAADVVYAVFVRIVLFPLIAYFEFGWLRQHLDRFLSMHGVTPLSLPAICPALASLPAVVFAFNFAVLDLADYWKHRVSHKTAWWYGIHSLHHAENQLTFWSDDRSHVLEDAITYFCLIIVGLVIGVPSMQFPFLILCFRFLGSVSHANTRIDYGWAGSHILVSPQFHRTHHALRAAGRRSCNFGTALAVWDVLFKTARFNDKTFETGDAGAEPALVNGTWGEQQAAGLRRMVRLAKRARKVPRVGVMP